MNVHIRMSTPQTIIITRTEISDGYYHDEMNLFFQNLDSNKNFTFFHYFAACTYWEF